MNSTVDTVVVVEELLTVVPSDVVVVDDVDVVDFITESPLISSGVIVLMSAKTVD